MYPTGLDVLNVLMFSILICLPHRHGVMELLVYALGVYLFYVSYSLPGLCVWTLYAGFVSLLRGHRV